MLRESSKLILIIDLIIFMTIVIEEFKSNSSLIIISIKYKKALTLFYK